MNLYRHPMFETGIITMESYLQEFSNRLTVALGMPIRFAEFMPERSSAYCNQIYIYPAYSADTMKFKRKQFQIPREGEPFLTIVNTLKAVLKDFGMKKRLSKLYSVTVMSFEEIAIGSCLERCVDALREETMRIGYHNNLGKIAVAATRRDNDKLLPDKCDHTFLFRNDYYLDVAKETGITDLLRAKGFELAKPYDVFGCLTDQTYEVAFYETNTIPRGLLYEYSPQLCD